MIIGHVILASSRCFHGKNRQNYYDTPFLKYHLFPLPTPFLRGIMPPGIITEIALGVKIVKHEIVSILIALGLLVSDMEFGTCAAVGSSNH